MKHALSRLIHWSGREISVFHSLLHPHTQKRAYDHHVWIFAWWNRRQALNCAGTHAGQE
jgi:aromatic ring-cleaving dioxygenase